MEENNKLLLKYYKEIPAFKQAVNIKDVFKQLKENENQSKRKMKK